MFKGQKANLDSVFPVHLLSWAWREHQVITWTRRPWAQHRKGTFITDQLQLSDVPGEEKKCLRMKTGEMEDTELNKRFPGLNLHPETASRFGSRHLRYRCRGRFTHEGHICVTFELVDQGRWDGLHGLEMRAVFRLVASISAPAELS